MELILGKAAKLIIAQFICIVLTHIQSDNGMNKSQIYLEIYSFNYPHFQNKKQ